MASGAVQWLRFWRVIATSVHWRWRDTHLGKSEPVAGLYHSERYGQVVPTDIVLSPFDIDVRTLIEAAQRAENAGFDAIWTYDHVSGVVMNARSTLDVWVALTAIACHTERVGIGPLVLNATTRDPAQLAVAAATLQDLSGGRLTLGLGAGAGAESPYSRELKMFRAVLNDAPSRRTRVIESIQFLRALWGGERQFNGSQIGFDGVDGVLTPRPMPPIVVGANGPRMAALAGTYADGLNLHSWQSGLLGLIGVAREAADRAGNHDFEVSLETPFELQWLDPTSKIRRAFSDLGIARVQVGWNASIGLDAIAL